jgi:glycerol-3-phosphate dehydrogenase (NAD(P)+)
MRCRIIMLKADTIKNVSIIGAGSWGMTIAKVIAENRPDINILVWAYEKSVVSEINKSSTNGEFLPGIQFPANIRATNSLKDCVSGMDAVIIATPSKVIPDISQKISKYLPAGACLGFLSKGFCKLNQRIYTISQTLGIFLPGFTDRAVAIYGPSHAEEVSLGYHTCLNVASKDAESRGIFSGLLTNSYLQCRETDDIMGVEVGGTLKNPAAIAAGIISVLPECGDNLAGALISEALKEMLELSKAFKARESTILDISGLGDLIATALSDHSRNRRFGKDIAGQILKKGRTLNILDRLVLKFRPASVIERMSEKLHYLAEGAYAIEPLIDLADMEGLSIPVYRSLYEVLLNKKNPSLLIETIKNPEKYHEFYFSTKIQVKGKRSGFESVKGRVFRNLIMSRTVEKFTARKGEDADGLDLLSSMRDYYHAVTTRNPYELSGREARIILQMTRTNYEKSLIKLSRTYADMIADNYSFFAKWFFLRYIKLTKLFSMISGGKGGISFSGDTSGISRIKKSVNIIYASTCTGPFDHLYIISLIDRLGLPFPRFFVNSKSISRKRDRLIIRLIGGFIVNPDKISNPVYRETLCQYLSTMIENGMPLLYFPDHSGDGSEFISAVSDSLYKFSVEIALVPVEIACCRSSGKDQQGLFGGNRTADPHVHFSNAVFLSDYTSQPQLVLGLPDLLRNSWNAGFDSMPPVKLARILKAGDYSVGMDDAGRIISEDPGGGRNTARLLLKEAVKFLSSNNYISVSGGVITAVDRDAIDYLAEIMVSRCS